MIVQVAPTRDRILEAARYLFWEKGYAATGMAEILERAQANAGSFYHFFPGKESLLLAVLETYVDGLEPAILRPASANRRDPIQRIFAILAGYRERLVSAGDRSRESAGARSDRAQLRSLDRRGPRLPRSRPG